MTCLYQIGVYYNLILYIVPILTLFQNMIRIIRTFMEDYRCQLGDFDNILHQTDKYMSANGNENRFVSHKNVLSNYCGSDLIFV